MLIWAVACTTLPESIPNEQGTITESELPTLLSIASPDLPILPWLTMSQLNQEDWRACPKIYNDSAISADGYDCVDSSGINWSGNASFTASGSNATITMSNFGPSGIEGGWLGTGTVDIRPTNSGGFFVDTKLRVDSWDGDPQTWWVDTEMGLGTYDGGFYAEHYDGTIGLEGWGLATVTGKNIFLATTMGCGYADHAVGTMALAGKNEAEILFDVSTGGPPAPPAQDTGFADTGDTGYRDTGDTGLNPGTGSDTPDLPFDPSGGTCGVCATATIDGAAVPGCVSAERSMAFAFPLLY